jgi:hypothetical protein
MPNYGRAQPHIISGIGVGFAPVAAHSFYLDHEPLGTWGKIRAGRGSFADASLLAAHADNLMYIDAGEFLAACAARPLGRMMIVLAPPRNQVRRCGIFEADTRSRAIVTSGKAESPPSDHTIIALAHRIVSGL